MARTPFKMKGYTYPGTAPTRKTKPPAEDVDKLVTYTDPNKPADYGGSDTTIYETRISKGTANLIKHNAPKEVIEKAKARDLEKFKESQRT